MMLGSVEVFRYANPGSRPLRVRLPSKAPTPPRRDYRIISRSERMPERCTPTESPSAPITVASAPEQLKNRNIPRSSFLRKRDKPYWYRAVQGTKAGGALRWMKISRRRLPTCLFQETIIS
jgi:hypothetical protein